MDISFVNSGISVSGIDHMFTAAIHGLRERGVKADFVKGRPKSKNVAVWGWRKGLEFRKKGYNILVFERGYLGDRHYWTSIAWNGLNGYGNFCNPSCDPTRFNQNFTLKPWRDDGKYIIIMGQINGDMSLMGKDLTRFYEQLARDLAEKYQKPVFFRPHPMAKPGRMNFRPEIPCIAGTLEENLRDAYLVAGFNSNSGVDAVVNGIPSLSFDVGSMAYEVTGHEGHDRIKPDRKNWAAKLAWCQWSPEEIMNASYWDRLSAGRK